MTETPLIAASDDETRSVSGLVSIATSMPPLRRRRRLITGPGNRDAMSWGRSEKLVSDVNTGIDSTDPQESAAEENTVRAAGCRGWRFLLFSSARSY